MMEGTEDGDDDEEVAEVDIFVEEVNHIFQTITDRDVQAFRQALNRLLLSPRERQQQQQEEGEELVNLCFDYHHLTPSQRVIYHRDHTRVEESIPYYGKTMLVYAIEMDCLPIVNELLEHGVSLHPQCSTLRGVHGGCTCHPMMIALQYGHLAILHKLVSVCGMDINVYKPLKPGSGPGSRRGKFRFSETLHYALYYPPHILTSTVPHSVPPPYPLGDHHRKYPSHIDLLRYCLHETGIDCTAFLYSYMPLEIYRKYYLKKKESEDLTSVAVDDDDNEAEEEDDEDEGLDYLMRLNTYLQVAWSSSAQEYLSKELMSLECALNKNSSPEDLKFWLETMGVPLDEETVLKMTSHSAIAMEYFAEQKKKKQLVEHEKLGSIGQDGEEGCPNEKRPRVDSEV